MVFLIFFLVVSCFFVFVRVPPVRAAVTWTYSAGSNTATASGTGTTNFADLVAADVAGGWGKFSADVSGEQIIVNGRVVVGDGTNAVSFVDSNKQVLVKAGIVTENSDYIFLVSAGSSVTLGVLVNDSKKETMSGCSFMFLETTRTNTGFFYCLSGGTVNFYSCSFQGVWGVNNYLWKINGNIYNCNLNGAFGLRSSNSNNYNLYITNSSFGLLAPLGSDSLVKINNVNYALYSDGSTELVFRGLNVSSVGSNLWYGWVSTGNVSIVDSFSEVWSFGWGGGATSVIFRQYSFDLVVLNGNVTDMIGNANVTLYKGTSKIGSWLTNSSGQIGTQTLTYGYYDSGHGNTIQGASDPFYLHIKASGYADYDSKFYVTAPMALTVSMPASSEVATPDPSTYTLNTEADSQSAAVGLVVALVVALMIGGLFFARMRGRRV